MDYYVASYEGDWLMHHGVKGQKWGVRRYQNYDGTLIRTHGRTNVKPIDKKKEKVKAKVNKINRELRGQNDQPKFQSLQGTDRYGITKSSKGVPEDILNDAVKVNGGSEGHFDGFNREWNCAFCATAYEMRRRGQNVQAQESLSGVARDVNRETYKDLKKKDIRDGCTRSTSYSKDIGMTDSEYEKGTGDILKDGANSRGAISVQWKAPAKGHNYAGGHALNYEVKDNKFYLVDPQIGKVYSGNDAKKYMQHAADVKSFRTDNLKVDTKRVNRYVEPGSKGIDFNKEYQKARKDGKTASVWAGVGSTVGFYGGAALGVLAATVTGNAAFVPIGAAGVAAASFIVSGAYSNAATDHMEKGKELAQDRTLQLEDQWKKEKRDNWYVKTTPKKK